MYETTSLYFDGNSTINEYFVKSMKNPDQFEKEWTLQEEQKNFADPYNSMWMKIGMTASCLIQMFESVILVCFVYYETQGLAGPFRTVINQLLSALYTLVSKIKTFTKH